MISPLQIQELATKNQTSEINIAREYLQHLFLSSFYKKEGSEKFLFKGGTALRIIFGSPRYSEDLDFSAPVVSKEEIENLLIATFLDLEAEGITHELKIEEAVETIGGYLADISLNILGFSTGIKSNIQIKRDLADLVPEEHLIQNPPFLTAYSIVALSTETIVKEKIQALLARFKPRDFFDLFFILRDAHLRKFVPRDAETTAKILKVLDDVTDSQLLGDLKEFLPIGDVHVIKTLKTKITEIFTA